MADDIQRSRLGRGLAALIGDVSEDVAPGQANAEPRRVPIEALRPNPRNPRRDFPETELDELGASIRAKGLIQPVVVRRSPSGSTEFEIVAGERRWRAAQRAGLAEIPIVVVTIDDKTSLEFAIVENVQRSDLNAIEEATGYQSLIDEFGHTQADLAQSLGRSRSHIANTLRLLKLPDDVRARLIDRSLSAGHARTLLGLDDPSGAAKDIVEQGLSVRQAEELAQRQARQAQALGAPETKGRRRDADIVAIEQALEEVLGLSVAIRHSERGGVLRISYHSIEQLDALCKSLMGQ
jgi:ParB family chromosome partitioning protein